MIFLKTESSHSRPYRMLVPVGLPILIAMGLQVSFNPMGDDRRVFIDFEVLQYLFAAVLAAIGGFFGIVVVVIAALVKSIHYAGEIYGFRVEHRGSIGEVAALFSIAHLFSQKTRLQMLLRTNSVAIPGALLLIALCAVTIETHTFLGFRLFSSWAYVYLLLSAFYYGLSSIRLLPGIVIVLLIGSASTLLCGLGAGFCTSKELLSFKDLSLLQIRFFGLSDPSATLILVYVALLGRGLRKRWLAEERSVGIDRIADGLTSLRGLIAAAIFSILIWEFSISLQFGWEILVPEETERYFRTVISLSSGYVFSIVPFVGFCMGALYGARGVWFGTLCFISFVLALQVGLALKIGDTSFGGTHMFADTIKLSYTFQGVNVGRGLALPLYAVLGMIVTKITAFYTQPGGNRRSTMRLRKAARGFDFD